MYSKLSLWDIYEKSDEEIAAVVKAYDKMMNKILDARNSYWHREIDYPQFTKILFDIIGEEVMLKRPFNIGDDDNA